MSIEVKLDLAAVVGICEQRHAARLGEFPACNGTQYQQELAHLLWKNSKGALTPEQAAKEAGTTLKK
jgi:hypothetical protein